MPSETFLQPRLEGEIAFRIGKPLRGPDTTLEDVLEATEALAVAVEVVDSRIEDWRIKLVDTIADNASYGGFTVGPWSDSLREVDLRTIGMLIHQNDVPVVEGIGAAALGHPARAVAWLANKLASFEVTLEPGDIVLSGSLGESCPCTARGCVRARGARPAATDSDFRLDQASVRVGRRVRSRLDRFQVYSLRYGYRGLSINEKGGDRRWEYRRRGGAYVGSRGPGIWSTAAEASPNSTFSPWDLVASLWIMIRKQPH